MSESKPIDVPSEVTSQAVVVREQAGAVGYALSIDELHRNLEFVRDVMRKEMREGQDYGKIPGTGDKPTLLQPGAQKLLMTFNLVEKVKREVLRDFPNLHREYEFTLTVCAQNGKEWDGVGTCSTLEAKYRYRKAERKCPTCGKHTIIAGKEEYGGGWVCFKKKGGCGAKFAFNEQSIQSQQVGRVEHDNPPDYWNTVRKMAFKRALVHASINATNTSELWTQDVEDMGVEAPEEPIQNGVEQSRPVKHTTPAPAASPTPKAEAPQGNGTKYATQKHLSRLVEALMPQRELAERFFRAIDWLLPTESLENLELAYVPVSKEQFDALSDRLAACENGEPATAPYPPNPRLDTPKAKPETYLLCQIGAKPEPKAPQSKPIEADPEWWRKIIVPIPHKDQKRDDYMKNPETIGGLYDLRHGTNDLAQEARQRLWGFINHYEAKPWIGKDGKERPPSASDVKFREALDACAEWHKNNHPDEKL